jgi:hypothetical protein
MLPLVIAIQTNAVASNQLRSLGVSDLGVSGMVQWNAYSIHILFA